MGKKTFNYQFIIRIIGILVMFILIPLSEFNKHMTMLAILAIIYVINAVLARLDVGLYKYEKYHVYNLYLDVLMLSLAIGVRGGLRSDFYLGYFIILGYILVIDQRNILFKFSFWIVINYSIITIIFTDPDNFSYGRLIIRMVLLIITTLLLKVYVRILADAETRYEKVVKSAMIDQLTNIYNRKILVYLDQIFDKKNGTLYIALLDIDDFKKINDQYGHIKGDEVLIKLSKIMKDVFNDAGICVRYGGEEFLIIFQGNDDQEIERRLNQVKTRFNQLKYTWLKDNIQLSFTVGYSSREEGDSLERIIDEADQALYKGKNTGKNKVISYKKNI